MFPEYCKYNNTRAAKKTKRLVLLGASGSIGKTSLSFLAQHKDIKILGLSVHSSLDFVRDYLSSQASVTPHIAITDPKCRLELEGLASSFPQNHFYGGGEGLLEMLERAREDGADTALIAIVGAAGIAVTLRAIELGMKLALANKESLVTAGPVIQKALEDSFQRPLEEQALLLPVDSEHNSVFRLLYGLKGERVRRLILSASGGPFRDMKAEQLKKVTKAEVLRHPNWSMGAKISVDSAGMINKGLEIIEAHYLFSCPYESLDAWVHRESLVHALIELGDGSYLFHASHTDMVFPIAQVLFFPEPLPRAPIPATTPLEWKALDFKEIAKDLYPGFYVCLEAGRLGGTAPAMLNAANECAVAAFLREQIHFTQIVDLIKMVMEQAKIEDSRELEVFLEADKKARSLSKSCLAKLS